MDDSALDPVMAAARWLREDGRAVMATVISTWGSAPVPVGGQMAVSKTGLFAGSVSGGCIEADVIGDASEVIEQDRPKRLDFGISDDAAWRSGLACGGKLSVLLQPLTSERDAAFLNAVLESRANRRPMIVRTNLASGHRTTEIGSGAALLESGVEGEGAASEFRHVMLPVVHLVIAGATEAGQALAVMARPLGWKITVVDPRSAFANENRFAGFETLVEWPDSALGTLSLDERTALVALTHAGHIDDEALSSALTSPCAYVGALGSRKTHAARIERLKAAGHSEEQIGRIRAPVGLNINAKTPGEIAVSILAEIVATFRGA